MPEVNKEEIIRKIQDMDRKAFALTDEERMHICDMGFYNETIAGYLILAMQNAKFSNEEIGRALNGLKWAFDDTTAAEAAAIKI